MLQKKIFARISKPNIVSSTVAGFRYHTFHSYFLRFCYQWIRRDYLGNYSNHHALSWDAGYLRLYLEDSSRNTYFIFMTFAPRVKGLDLQDIQNPTQQLPCLNPKHYCLAFLVFNLAACVSIPTNKYGELLFNMIHHNYINVFESKRELVLIRFFNVKLFTASYCYGSPSRSKLKAFFKKCSAYYSLHRLYQNVFYELTTDET